MTSDEMREVVRIVTEAVTRAVDRRLDERGVTLRAATVTQSDPLMVRLDGATTPSPARASGGVDVGSRVLVLRSGTSLTLVGGGMGDVEASDLAPGFVLPVSAGGTGATTAAQARANLGAGTPYSLPAATASARGGVRVGSGLKVSGDVLSVDNGAYVTSLWTGSAAGSVTLSESVAGYRALVATIAGTDGVREASTLVWSPNGATFDVGIAFVAGSNGWRSMRMRYRASGTSLTCLLNERYTGTGTVTGELRLVSVVGIK